nr:DmsC/YnfH family molybdoenzyme membrane anchor subunit [Sulfurimonas sp. MAG313]
MNESTPLENFINYKADTGMQCGNYSIDLPELQDDENYRFHFDATACVGCRCCEVACNEQNNNPADIKWRRVGESEGGVFPDVTQLFNSMACNHCIDPACLIGCPTNSYIKIEETGIVIHDDPSCIGCQYCTWNCPYGVPTFHEERSIVTKCHMCHERLDVGQSPACVQACPSGAIEIEVFKPKQWLAEEIDEKGNMPHLVDARVTNSTTRYTLPENMPELTPADDYHLKPSHSELPLVFMTVLTQVSLGAFLALFLGDLLSFSGKTSPSWIMALLVMLPAAIGLPLSALHLGRPLKALTAMINIKTSWLSREALALGLFTGFMSINVLLYFLEVNAYLRIFVEAVTLGLGAFGIYAQGMIYQIVARPSWNRVTTIFKFFGVGYIGMFLVAFALLVQGEVQAASPLLTLALLLALAQAFFSYEDKRSLHTASEYESELQKTSKLYETFFILHQRVRLGSFILGSLILPILVTVIIDSSLAPLVLGFALIFMSISELMDRFLFYTTVVPLNMAGGFFVGKQRP